MRMITITKSFSFSASHTLETLPEDHPCRRLHGHNYEVTVELGAEYLNDNGMVVDYRELDGFKLWLDTRWDHRHLNDVMQYDPTAERLAAYLATTVLEPEFGALLRSVTVSETPKTTAKWTA